MCSSAVIHVPQLLYIIMTLIMWFQGVCNCRQYSFGLYSFYKIYDTSNKACAQVCVHRSNSNYARNRGVHECWIIAATQVSPTNQNWILLLLESVVLVLTVIKIVGADSRLLSILKKWEIVNGHARLVVFIPVWRVMVCFVTLSPPVPHCIFNLH